MAIKDLEKKRSTLSKKIIRIQAQVLGWTPETVRAADVDIQITGLQDYREKLEDLYDDTAAECKDDNEFANHDVEFTAIYACLDKIEGDLKDLKSKKEDALKFTASPSFKLERIKIPKFSGSFTEWQSFSDLFKSSVDNNPSISGAEKLIHLKSSLVGEAASTVASFPTTDASYKEAWNCVQARYSQPREVIFAHIQKLDFFKPLTTDTSQGLRSLVDTINECVRSLKVLKVPVEHWDLILVYFGLKKLSPEVKKEWSLWEDEDLPTLKDFIAFLEEQARAMSTSVQAQFQPKKIEHPTATQSKSKPKSPHHVSSSTPVCPKCSNSHRLYKCDAFISLPLAEKKNFVVQNNLCFNCLFKGHASSQCKMNFSCRKCMKRHHTFLHEDPPLSQQAPPVVLTVASATQKLVKEGRSINSSLCTSVEVSSHVILLGTLVVTADNASGDKTNCRVFVDPGSESNFISEQCVNALGIRRRKTCVNLNGIGGHPSGHAKGIVSLRLFSKVRGFHLDISALILEKITNPMPRAPAKQFWPHLKGLEISDPNYYRPGHVDILLGAEHAARIMLSEIVKGPHGSPIAQNTEFGWMLSGRVEGVSSNPILQATTHHTTCAALGDCLDSTMERFWKLEEPEIINIPLTKEDEECEKHFVSTSKRDPDGSFTVSLPFRNVILGPGSSPPLGNSKLAAIKRFLTVEKKFSHQPKLKEEYLKYIKDYTESDFMELVPHEDLSKPNHDVYYMPHHVVIKESSSTTKYRVVFDASAHTSTAVSLNDVLLTGPKIQIDLVPLLIRFRSHVIAMSADIVKFYPQYKVNPSQLDYQRFVWRESPDLPLEIYRMKRLTFGVKPAPFLAIRCLHQLADEENSSFPIAAPILKQDFLVDNLLTGSHDIESALLIQNQLCQVMERGKLKLRKWMSNSKEIVSAVPADQRESSFPLSIDDGESVKTIGLLWNPLTDTFGVNIVVPDLTQGASKRKVLSSIARIFDPLGWLSPVTIKPKVIMQEIWRSKISWDSPLPPLILKQWVTHCQELKTLEKFQIERCITRPLTQSGFVDKPESNSSYELHGFSDASKSAYAACIYLKTIDYQGQGAVILVTAKSKVAPVKSDTTPRLELCGADLLSKLMKTVLDSLKLDFTVIRCWTDSQDVCDWLVSNKKLPVFVSNRVRSITQIIPAQNWYHVPGKENPADMPSRGIPAARLISDQMWFNGPPWLAAPHFQPNVSSMVTQPAEPSQLCKLINKCSSYLKMKRVVAYCIRFVRNSRLKKEERQLGLLSVEEINQSLTKIVFIVQAESFAEEIRRCKKNLVIKSNVKFMSPFLDQDGNLRVGGRLRNSALSYGQRHPLLLPKRHHFTKVVARHLHLCSHHAGPQLLLALIRDQFWIVGGPDLVKQIPPSRVNPSRPFSQSGLDYAGPYHISLRAGRNPPIIKAYICLFVCMSTKAVHLEWTTDLTTAAFIGSLNRFISRRGRPADIYCDCGTNFVGANAEFQEILKFLNSKANQDSLQEEFSDKGLKFHFNPPSSPHHGGLWEAAVKSMKVHLKRVIGDRHLTLEEFSTLLCQVESCLNSRPISAMSNDPNDFNVPTPGHFLTGSSLNSLPDRDITHLNIGRLSRWQALQQLQQHFWRRWQSEYLSVLQSRPKWFSLQLVLIRDDDANWGTLKWKLGRIVNVYPGKDGKIRVCDVKSATGTVYKRPVVKLSPVPIYQ